MQRNSVAQLSTKYTFVYNGTTTYASIGGTTVTAAVGTDAVFTAIPIGFTFAFNCNNYTTVGLSTNGFLWFGSGTCSATQYAPLSSQTGETGAVDGIISLWGVNVTSGNPLRYITSGSSPNRIFTVEWKNIGPSTGGLDCEIKLYETSNQVELIYWDNSYFLGGTATGQTGMRGNVLSDFVNRKATGGGANNWCSSAAGTLNTDVSTINATTSCNYATSASSQQITFRYTYSSATCCTQPGSNATSFGYANLVPASGTGTVGFTRGTGDGGVIMIIKDGSAPTGPSNGTAYIPANASAVYGSGTALGGGYLIFVENGSGSGLRTVNLTGLTTGHSYYFAVYEYNATATCYFATALSGGFCYGPPLATTVTPSPTTVCLGTSTTLSLTGLSAGGFYTYQWQYSATNGSGYATASGTSTNSTYGTPTTLPSDPSYYVSQVTCPNTGDVTQSSQGTVNLTSFLSCYCSSGIFAAAATATRGIVNVTLVGNSVTINNTTAANTTSPYYTLYSSPVADLSALSSYSLQVKVGTQAANNYGTAWIDYDHSGTFGGYNISGTATSGGNYNSTGTVERIGSFGPANASVITTLAFTVPGSSLSGTTGMRVLYRYNSSAATVDACGPVSGAATTGGAGEVEDYRVTISTCTPPTTQAINASTSSVTTTTGTISWIPGNGTGGDIVVLSQGSAVNSNPVQGNVYTPNTAFGGGTQIGTGNYVMSQGVTGTVNITGLILNTTYYYAIYTFSSGALCYKTPALTGSFTTLNGAMTYVSSTTNQQTGNVSQGVSNQAIVQLQVVMGSGTSPALSLTSLTFNTNGTTNISGDVTAARIWYTGNSSSYATSTQFGTTVTVFPGGSTAIPVTGSQTLLPGTNYFWVAYDINIAATIANVVDAECPTITIVTPQTPTVTAPAGSRPIVALAGIACAYTGSNQTIALSTIVGVGGTTTIASGTSIDDNNYSSQSFPAGFNFEYNGQVFTSYGINSNGFIWFGSGTPNTNSYSPIGNLTASGTISGVLCPFGTDLIAHQHTSYSPATPSISVGVTGTTPNRIYTVEWNGFYSKTIYNTGTDGGCYPTALFGIYYNDAHRLDFQIKLYETGGSNSSRIEFVYRDQNPVCINTGYPYQIGIRGSSAADYLTRANSGSLTPSSSTNGGAATTTNAFGSANYINGSVGIRFTPNILTPALTPTPTATNTCPAVTVLLTGSVTVPASPAFQWYLNNIAISGATNSTYSAPVSGTYVMVASNAGCGRVSNSTVATIISCCATTGLWTGTISTDWNTAGNWCGGIPTATTDVVINSGTPNDPLINTGAVATCNNLSIGAGASLSIAANTLNMKGNLTITPTGFYVHYGGTLELNGTTPQSIPDISCYNLKINNSAGVVITGDVTVTNVLNLFNGKISTGGSIITISNSSSNAVINFNNTNYIDGRLIRYINNGVFDFPIGDAVNYELATVTVNNLAPVLYLLGEYFSNNSGCTDIPNVAGGPYVNGTPLTTLLNAGFWTITPDGQPTTGTYNIQINERGYTNTPPGPSYCAVIKRDDCISLWHSLGVHTNATQSISGGTVTAVRTGLTSFSDFGVGFSGSVLPIQLISFTATKCTKDLDALLQWTTASELNNDHFELEVATTTNPSSEFAFKKIGQVGGHGTSQTANDYNFIDREPNKSGVRYYRLKQVDADGNFNYSNVISLSFSSSGIVLTELYPNPTDNLTNFNLQVSNETIAKISFTNILGKEELAYNQELKVGENQISVDVSQFAQGFYFLNITGGNGITIHKKFEKY